MVVAAAKSGYRRGELEKALPRIQEIPFDSDRKRMTTIHRVDGAHAQAAVSGFGYPPVIAFVKGAPDVILDLCGHRLEAGQAVGLTRGHARGDTRAEPRHGEQRAAGARGGLSPAAGSPGQRDPGNRREGSRLRRPARHDRPAAARGDRGAEGGPRRRPQEHHGDRRLQGHRRGHRPGHRPADPGRAGADRPGNRKAQRRRNWRPGPTSSTSAAGFRPSTRRGSSTPSRRAATSWR